MTITMYGPNGVKKEFPDGTDQATIDQVMRDAVKSAPPTGDAMPPADGPVYQNPRPTWVPEVSGMDAFTFGMGQGAGANFTDEMAAGIKSGSLGGPDYDKELNRQRAFVHAAEEQHPWAFSAGNTVGALPWALLPAERIAATSGPIARTVVGGVTGAVQGALSGFGAGEGAEDRASRAVRSGAITGGIGAAIPGIGATSGWIARKLGKSRTAPAAGVVPGQRDALSREFDVPLTTGQKTGNLKQQAKEEAMANVGRGDIPARVMQSFKERQIAANRAASEQIGANTAKGIKVGTAADAGDVAIAGVKGRANALKSQAQAQYERAEMGDLTLHPDAIADAARNVELRVINNDVSIVPALHPSAMQAMRDIEQLSLMNPATRGKAIDPASLAEIERTRRSILKMKGVNDDDRRVLGVVKDSFDDWLDDAVDNSLFSGDPDALDALKDARKLWRDYKNITSGKGPDEANRKIASFFQKDVTGQEVANWITGSAALGGSGSAYRTAGRLKSILGPDSDEWGAVRQGVWASLTGGPDGGPGPQKTASTLYEFLEGKGKPLATVLYTPAERAKMLRYAELQKTMVPDPRATNPSKSSYGVARQMSVPMWSMIASSMGAVGLDQGGGPGAMAGIAAATSIPIFRQAAAISAAKRAASGKIVPSRTVSRGLQVLNKAVTPAVLNSLEKRDTQPAPQAIPGR